jgi:hypothetical protein
MEHWFRDAAAIGLLALVAILFLWPAWRQPFAFWYLPGAEFSDLTVTHWPNMWFVAQTFRQHGQIPLWRPLIMGGAPFVGNPLSAMFYPLNWPFVFLPVTPFFHVSIALHLAAAGVLAYALLRWGYRRSVLASLVAGLSYMLTPKLIAHLGAGHIGLSQAFAWLPLDMWLVRRALQGKSAHRGAWAGVGLAMTFLADPRVAFYGALLLAAYTLWWLIALWRVQVGQAVLRLALRMLLVPLVFVGVGAVQIVPTLELMRYSSRAALSLAEAGRESLPWRYLMGYIIADWGGHHEWMTYLGLAVLGLAVYALRRAGQRDRWFWLGTWVISLWFGLGNNALLYPLLYRLLPGLSWLRVPPRVLLLSAISSSVLAAFGFDVVFERPRSDRARRRITLGAFGGIIFCVGIGLGFWLLLGDQVPPAVIAFAAIGVLLLSIVLAGAVERIPRMLLKSALLVVLVADLWLVDQSLLTLRLPNQVFAEGRAAAEYLAAQEGLFRIYSPSYSIAQQVGAWYGLQQLDGVDPTQLQWMSEFMAKAGGYQIGGYTVTMPYYPDNSDVRQVLSAADPNSTLLGLLNGRFIVAEFPIEAPGLRLVAQVGGSYLYENEHVLPRAFTVTRVERVSGWQAAQARIADGFDPAGGALIEGGVPLYGENGIQPAQILSFTPNRIVVEAEVEREALLVLSEVWFPGWQVAVDGKRTKYYRIDGIVRGVYLDPGAHRIEWRYRPGSLRWGGAITALTVIGWCAAAIWSRKGRR